MKITKFGDGIPVTLAGWSTGITSINSNATTADGGLSAINFVQRITSNGSNILLNPSVNFAAGSGISLSASSNTVTISSTSGSATTFPGAVVSHGSMGATETLDYSQGTYHYGTLDANCTISFTGWTTLKDCGITFEVTEDGTGGWTPTFSGVTWLGGTTPTHDTTAGTTTIYAFFSRDGGTTIVGGQLGAGGTVTYGTPALVLGTVAAAGSTDEAIRRDSTIVAFDATVPVTQAFGDAAATGAAAVAARRDHVHGMPASGAHYLTISSSHSTPLVFDDIVQSSAGDDFIYSSS